MFRPRSAFARLRETSTWGWAAVIGLLLTLASVLIGERAQLHLLALTEAQRMATLSPADQLRERVAVAQVAHMQHFLFILGSVMAPWVIWLLIAVLFFVIARLSGTRACFALVWAVVVNAYIIYALGAVANAALVATRDPASLRSPLDLVGLPSLHVLAPGNSPLSAFLAAYHLFNLWYLAVVAIGLRVTLRLSLGATITVTVLYGLLLGALSAWSAGSPP